MPIDYLNIGSTPPNEDCAQLGSQDYAQKTEDEAKRYIALIREKCGKEPLGASLRLKWFPHDFGMYAEVVCFYNTSEPAAEAYAYHVESEGPLSWDDTEPAPFEFKEEIK